MADVTRSTKLRFYNGVGKDEARRTAATNSRIPDIAGIAISHPQVAVRLPCLRALSVEDEH
jgi:hypothetical protein